MADVTSHEAPVHKAGMLPVDAPQKLIGRDTTLARVYTHLKENRAVLLYGPAGIGKSAVAATLASAYTELPGGSLWLPVDNPTFADLLVRVGRAYNLSTITTSNTPLAFVGAAATALSREKPLIVLDGKISAAVAQEFLTRLANNLPMLILNDEDIDGGWTKFPLNALEPTQAAALLRAAADLQSASQEEIAHLAQVLNYTPFAIVLASGHLRATKQSPEDFRAALPPANANVSPSLLALTVVFKGLSSALQGLLFVLGATQHGAASAELIGMVGKAQPELIQQAMGMLIDRHLVIKSERYGMPYYQLHPMTFTFAQSWLRGLKRLDGLQANVREAILAYARKYTASTADAHNHLAAEMDNFIATAKAAADAGDRELANQLSVAMLQAGDFTNERGYVAELLLLRGFAASQTVPFSAYKDTAEARGVTSTSTMIAADDEELLEDEESDRADELDEAEFDDENEMEEDEDVSDEVIPFDEAEDEDLDEDDLDEDEDDLDEDDLDDEDEETGLSSRAPAVRSYAPPIPSRPLSTPPTPTRLSAFSDEADDEDEESVEVIEDSSLIPPVESDEAARLRTQVVQARQSGDRRKQAELLMQLGSLQRTRGLENEATSTYSEALSVLENLTDDRSTLTTLNALAELTVKSENYQPAALYAARAANLSDKLGDDVQQVRMLTVLGDARQQLGESKDAARAYQRALDVTRTNGDLPNEAMVLYKLGYAYLDDSDPEQAIERWEEALALFRKQDRRDYEGRVLGGLGAAYSELERWTEAINFSSSALHIAREVKDKEEELLQLGNLGYALVQARQLGQAVLRYRQALHLAYASNDVQNVVGTTVDLARMLVESPRHLSIAELLIDGALELEPTSRDLKRLKERIEDEREALSDDLPEQASIGGTAREYAANAYVMLEQ
ncbi:MAG: tetratricopeptide repeat protein [Anaerolineae bacterium]